MMWTTDASTPFLTPFCRSVKKLMCPLVSVTEHSSLLYFWSSWSSWSPGRSGPPGLLADEELHNSGPPGPLADAAVFTGHPPRPPSPRGYPGPLGPPGPPDGMYSHASEYHHPQSWRRRG